MSSKTDPISALSAQIQEVGKKPTPIQIESLEAEVARLGRVIPSSQAAQLIVLSDQVQALKKAEQLPSSRPRPPVSNPELEKLTASYTALQKKVERGTTTLTELLTFQDQLLKASPLARSAQSFGLMQEGIEVMTAAILESGKSQTASKRSLPLFRNPSYEYRGERYLQRATSGHQSACAIHAVLGQDMGGIYRYNGDAKKHYTDTLIAAMGTRLQKRTPAQNRALEAYSASMRNYLTQNDRGAQMLFNTVEGRKLRAAWQAIGTTPLDASTPSFENQIRLSRFQEGRLWLPLVTAQDSPFLALIMDEVESTTNPTSKWYQKSPEQVIQMLTKDPSLIVDIVDIQREPNPFLALLEESDIRATGRILAERERRPQILQDLHRAQEHFIFSHDVVLNYVKTVNTNTFYLDTNDLKIVAHLFNKKVVVIEDLGLVQGAWSSRGSQAEIFGGVGVAHEEINLVHGEGEPIVIQHFGAHFSRCVKAEKLTVREEAPLQFGPKAQPTPSSTLTSDAGKKSLAQMGQNFDALLLEGKRISAANKEGKATLEEAQAFLVKLHELEGELQAAKPSSPREADEKQKLEKALGSLILFGEVIERQKKPATTSSQSSGGNSNWGATAYLAASAVVGVIGYGLYGLASSYGYI
ncbi:MAG: hypothetical protein AB7N99_08265 [Simkaniaceae bacterium]